MTEIDSLFESESKTILAAANAMCGALGLSEGADLDDLIQQIDFKLERSSKKAGVLAKARKAINALTPSRPRPAARRYKVVSPYILSALRAEGPLPMSKIISLCSLTSSGQISATSVRCSIYALANAGEIEEGLDGWKIVEVYPGQADLFQ